MSRPTRIAAIELRDFRAYPGGDPATVIPLTDEKGHGKNLLLYGENGSGKSSLGKAIRDFLDIRLKAPEFDTFRHAFTKPPDPDAHVTLLFDDSAIPALQWEAAGRDRAHKEFPDMARTRGWLDYRAVWRATEVGLDTSYVEVFGPLADDILLACEMPPGGGETFGKLWHRIQVEADKRPMKKYWERAALKALQSDIKTYNDALKAYLPDLQKHANYFLPIFAPGTQIELSPIRDVRYNSSLAVKFRRGEVALKMLHRGELLDRPAEFLNEARVTAVGLSLYLAGLSLGAPPKRGDGTQYCRVLILDDVLLSLDMTHRRPLLKLLEEKFQDWQVLLLTHDRAWYELACHILPENRWKRVELFAVRVHDYEKPVVHEDLPHLVTARRFLSGGHPKAAAVHARTEFEIVLKRACEELRLRVPYKADPRDLSVKDLWDVVSNTDKELQLAAPVQGGIAGNPVQPRKNAKVTVRLVSAELAHRVGLALSWFLNPLSHSETIERYRSEVTDAIDAIEELSKALEIRIASSPWNKSDLFKERDRLLKLLNWGSPENRTPPPPALLPAAPVT